MINYVLACILLFAGGIMAVSPAFVYDALNGRHDADAASQIDSDLAHIRIGGWIFCGISIVGILSTLYFQ